MPRSLLLYYALYYADYSTAYMNQGKSVLRLFAPSFPRSPSRTPTRGLSRTWIRERGSIGRKALIP
jgi:hypothetical protein